MRLRGQRGRAGWDLEVSRRSDYVMQAMRLTEFRHVVGTLLPSSLQWENQDRGNAG